MSLPLFKQRDALKDYNCYQDFVVFSSSRQPPSVTGAGQPAKRLSRIGWAFEAGGTMNAKTTWALPTGQKGQKGDRATLASTRESTAAVALGFGNSLAHHG